MSALPRICALFLALAATAYAQVPKGLDSNTKIFSATSRPTNPSLPEQITNIQSATDVTRFLATLNLQLLMPHSNVCNNNQAILLHTAIWAIQQPTPKSDQSFSLQSSQWTGLTGQLNKNGICILKQFFRPDKLPLFYGKKSVYLVGVNYFITAIQADAIQINYKVSTTAAIPQNIQDLGTLVSALVGFAPQAGQLTMKSATDATPVPVYNTFVFEGLFMPTTNLPYTVNVTPVVKPSTNKLPNAVAGQPYGTDFSNRVGQGKTVTAIDQRPTGLEFNSTTQMLSGTPTQAGDFTLNVHTSDSRTFQVSLPVKPPGSPTSDKGAPQPNQTPLTSPSQPIDCSEVSTANPCTFTRNFPVDDREYWDVSIGLAIPGTLEAIPTAPTATSSTGATSSLKRHTDAYALADFYLFAHRWPKQSWVPHINGGVPLTSQSLHRPYVGIGEDISGWLQRRGFPFDFSVFGGVVFMKQQISAPSGGKSPRTDWALKGLWGVEVPISTITSKLSGKSGGAKGGGKSGQ